jgi:hypothetical protein
MAVAMREMARPKSVKDVRRRPCRDAGIGRGAEFTAAADERRISMAMKVTTAMSENAVKAPRKTVSTVRIAAESTSRNARVARYT